MFGKVKRGSGSTLDPFYNYKNYLLRYQEIQDEKNRNLMHGKASPKFHIDPKVYDQKRLIL